MSRIRACYEKLAQEKRSALIPYIMAGDPQSDVTVPLMHAMVAAGANLIELGVPFSDPMADGPVIQAASERALQHHTGIREVIGMVAQFREQDDTTPVVLMGYLNPVEIMGYEDFAASAAAAGVDGVLTVDIPPEESHDLNEMLARHGLDPIYLIAPTSTGDRIRTICANASGFVYYVSLKGVTGAANLQVQTVADKVNEIRRYTDLPIGVGFGISDAGRAAQISQFADAVVVGSAIIKRVAAHLDDTQQIIDAVADLLQAMRKAMDE